MKRIKVESIEHLRSLVEGEVHEFFIRLNGGLRSSKFIHLSDNDELVVVNLIDDTTSDLSDTNVPEAIAKGAFFAELWED